MSMVDQENINIFPFAPNLHIAGAGFGSHFIVNGSYTTLCHRLDKASRESITKFVVLLWVKEKSQEIGVA